MQFLHSLHKMSFLKCEQKDVRKGVKSGVTTEKLIEPTGKFEGEKERKRPNDFHHALNPVLKLKGVEIDVLT